MTKGGLSSTYDRPTFAWGLGGPLFCIIRYQLRRCTVYSLRVDATRGRRSNAPLDPTLAIVRAVSMQGQEGAFEDEWGGEAGLEVVALFQGCRADSGDM